MAYIGKYVDRNPNLKAAGISRKMLEGAGDALRIYNKEEGAETVIRIKCKEKLVGNKKFIPRNPYMPESDLKDILSPELQKSRFVAFREKFSEDLYFTRAEVGKVYPLHSKPDHITNENTTFGHLIHRSEPVYELVLPKKTVDEVNREYIKWHDKYVISHKHYLPSEKINRGYDRKSFNPNTIFGMCTNVDATGGNVKRCLTQCDRLILVSKTQKDFIQRTIGRLGKKIPKYLYEVPQNMTFDKSSHKTECDAQALLENIDPCVEKSVLIDALAHINKWRHMLFKRLDYHAHDLKLALEKRDVDQTGYLSVSKICEAARSLLIRVDERKIRIALRHFRMIEDECLETERVNYDNFWKLLTIQFPMPMTGALSKMPNVVYNKDTTYRDLCRDLEKKPVTAPPQRRHNDDVITAKELIAPDIPMQYGLVPSDFEEPRTKEQLRRIFKRVLKDNFDEVWAQALERHKPENELLSVNQIRTAVTTNDNDDF